MREANTRPLNAPNASPLGDYTENEGLLVKSFWGPPRKKEKTGARKTAAQLLQRGRATNTFWHVRRTTNSV